MTGRPPLAKLAPDSLTERQRAVYDTITGGPRSHGPVLFPLVDSDGALEGPFNAFLLQPRLGHALQSVGSAIRYETTMTDRVREIAILLVGTHWDSAYERLSHEPVARHVGMTDTELAALRDGSSDATEGAFSDAAERVTARVVSELLKNGDLTDETYRDAVLTIGEAGVFELLTLVGYYSTLAVQMRVFRVAAPAPSDDGPMPSS